MRAIKFLLLILFSGLLLNCSDNLSENNIISESVFVDVLTDIHLADATLVAKGFRIKSDSTRVRLFYNDVLIEYNVTQKQIQNTFEFYARNPRKFEKVYEKISENIVKLEEQFLDKIAKEEEKNKKSKEKKEKELKQKI